MSMPMWEDLKLKMDPYSFNVTEALKKYDLPEWMKIWGQEGKHVNPQEILKLLFMVKEYDLLHLHPPSPIYLQFSSKPFVIHEAGWIRKLVIYDTPTERLGRRAYAKADCIVMTNPDTYELLAKLPYRKAVFIPFIIDTDRYKPIGDVRKKEGLLFFHPARQIWNVKGNDRLIRAFKKFISLGNKAKLRMVNWGETEDASRSVSLVRELGIERHVEWVQPYSKPDLIRVYSEADVVLDQFILGSGGTTLFEAMSCEVPVMIYLNEWNMKCFGEMPPIVNVRTVDEICEAMVSLRDPSLRKRIGKKERQFVLKHNRPEVVGDQLMKLYKEVLE
jgi:glycosyltransferase involved in cell wall biosynthesis